MRVNVDEALVLPTVTAIVRLPAATLGIVILAVKVPVEDVVILAGLVAIAAPSIFTVTDVFTGKPFPVIVTTVPTGPLVGDSVIEAAPGIVNVAVPIFPASSVAATI